MKADSIRSRPVSIIRMTNNIRVFLWLGLALALWLNYSQWQIDYGAKARPPAASAATDTTGAPKPSDISRYCSAGGSTSRRRRRCQRTQSRPLRPPAPRLRPEVETASARKIRVTTDVLVLDISLTGGTLVRAELPGYPLVKGEAAPWCCSTPMTPSTNYVLRTGLSNPDDPNGPTHLATFTAPADSFTLAPGQDELRVPLTLDRRQGHHGHQDFRLQAKHVRHRSRVPDRERHPGAVAGGAVRAHRALGSARRALHVQGRELRDARSGDLRRHQVPQARHRQARKTRRCRSTSRTAGSPACSITS